MTKKGRLSKKEQAYIAEHSEDDVTDIAEAIDRSENVVNKELSRSLSRSKEDGSLEAPRAGEFMARNEKYGAVTMTEQASMLGDESKDTKPEDDESEEVNIPRRHRGAIHRIKER